jgi:hypothetical protein
VSDISTKLRLVTTGQRGSCINARRVISTLAMYEFLKIAKNHALIVEKKTKEQVYLFPFSLNLILLSTLKF